MEIPTKVLPCIPVGVAVKRFSSPAQTIVQVGEQTTTVSLDESAAKAGVAAGLGPRVFASDNWNIHPKFKIRRYFTSPGVTVLQFSFGIFHHFAEQWRPQTKSRIHTGTPPAQQELPSGASNNHPFRVQRPVHQRNRTQ